MAFNPINTQEELDQIIQQRLERERKTLETKYADYDSLKTRIEELTNQLTDAKQKRTEAEKQVADLQNAVRAAELETLKGNIAAETGIPFALRGRLQGTTEEEIRKDAEMLTGLIGEATKRATPPAPAPKLNEDAGTSSDPIMAMVKNMNFGG